MRFLLPTSPLELQKYLPAFLDLIGADRWWKRANQLEKEANNSPFLRKIVADYHWLEMELSAQAYIAQTYGALDPQAISPQSVAALNFAAMAVEAEKLMSPMGRIQFLGRLRDSLKNDFAALFLEMDIAHGLMREGFDVEFTDSNNKTSYDISFKKEDILGEVECKSLSGDAGRKVHRKEFYRFIDEFREHIVSHVEQGFENAFVLTVEDRFPSDMSKRNKLATALHSAFKDHGESTFTGHDFVIERLAFPSTLNNELFSNERELYKKCTELFGDNSHVSGAIGQNGKGKCLIVVRSTKEDDHSKPTLECMKKAISQLSGKHPGFIAIQYEDITPQDLILPRIRRRAAILSNAIFHKRLNNRPAAIYFCAYNGLHAANGAIWKPAFVFWNPFFKDKQTRYPFRDSIRTSEYALLLGVDPKTVDPDDHLYGMT